MLSSFPDIHLIRPPAVESFRFAITSITLPIGLAYISSSLKEYGFKVVYASSSSVYGNPKQIPIKESDDRSTVNPYAQTKLETELLAEKYSEMGVKVIGLRFFNVFGKRQ